MRLVRVSSRGSAIPEESSPHLFVDRQIGATEEMVRNPGRILCDQWHGFFATGGGILGRILKKRAKPALDRVTCHESTSHAVLHSDARLHPNQNRGLIRRVG